VAWIHRPFNQADDPVPLLNHLFPEMRDRLGSGHKLLVHQEELGDLVSGVMASYLLWAGLVESGPKAISITERLVERQLGPYGRELVAVAGRLEPAGD
jgi:hypothetical protein